jgi:hypothetical protein
VPGEPAFVFAHAPTAAAGEDVSTAAFHEKIIALGVFPIQGPCPIALLPGVYDHCVQELF